MHELSVARSLIELASEHAKNEGALRVTRISVRLGTESVVFRSLYFCFDTATKGTICEDAVLDIEEVPLSVFCPSCDEAKLLPCRTSFRCPDCGTPTPKILTGREMQLISINLEFDEPVRKAPTIKPQYHENTGRA